MLRAGAMTYAIILSIIVGAFCMALIWISTAHRNTRAVLKNKERLIVNSLAGVDFTLNTENHTQEKLHIINNDTVYTTKSNWGMFNFATVTAVKNKRTLTRALLTGIKVNPKNLPALYLSDNNKPLKITGNTILRGALFVPKRGIERAFIQGKKFSNKDLYIGRKQIAEKRLPQLNKQITALNFETITSDKGVFYLDVLPEDSTFSFQNETQLFEKGFPLIIREKLSGNLIISSKDSIYVSNSAQLNNIILIAPLVRFEEGFEGTVQVFSEKQVVLEENVLLNYPSSIYLNDQNIDFRRGDTAIVVFKENAHLLGGVLITSTSPDYRNPVKLDISKDASIVGLVYNQGETQLKGRIIGSLYTNSFYLNTKSSSYTNHLMDAEINGQIIPEYFVFPNWLNNNNEKEAFIRWL